MRLQITILFPYFFNISTVNEMSLYKVANLNVMHNLFHLESPSSK